MLEFVAGIALARVIKQGWRLPLTIGWTIGLAALGYAALAGINEFVAAHVPQLHTGLPAFLVSACFFPVALLLIAGCAGAEADGATSWVGNRAHVALGEYSFAFYLVHMPVVTLTERLYPSAHGEPLAFAIIAVLSLALAACAYKIVERPCERLLRGWFRSRGAMNSIRD
jgi:peptidoglycan/LPS O-acetylase OafA/YrhL